MREAICFKQENKPILRILFWYCEARKGSRTPKTPTNLNWTHVTLFKLVECRKQGVSRLGFEKVMIGYYFLNYKPEKPCKHYIVTLFKTSSGLTSGGCFFSFKPFEYQLSKHKFSKLTFKLLSNYFQTYRVYMPQESMGGSL